MDSSDDLNDWNDLDLEDDDFYGGGNSDEEDDDSGLEENDSDDSEDVLHNRHQVGTIQSVNRVHDEWFADEKGVRKAVGLLETPMEMPSRTLACGTCFEVHPRDRMRSAACGHPFCISCWRGYIGTAINDGPGCLMLRCPNSKCTVAIGQDVIDEMATEEEKKKYERHLRRSYIEDNGKTKWCPAPGCEFAVDFVLGSESYDVTCKCSHSFCWNCTEETHRPVDCKTVTRWNLENSTESQKMKTSANSKPCPRCKQPIEKNRDFMRITCLPCKFAFCWLCLEPWSDHNERTGGFYSCNRYEAARQEGLNDETESRRKMAKNYLERYTHYYERWAANQSVSTKKISYYIVECRRVLKWTYAYGYYVPELNMPRNSLNIFKVFIIYYYLPGEAESGLERLHQCAEKELQVFIEAEGPSKDFNDFRTKLAGLTRCSSKYFALSISRGFVTVGTMLTGVELSFSRFGDSKYE
ncbi:unnamed protein product [Spirodela intermedia]|uniref:RBR-type E3 ubiquitin transferase n=1 Tax=Spirodela intermedia TaxID=51605 RepID=A0A7I8J1C0_SPIIN|nr:unnamed protein product [Spirodela intermedia]CAA6663948.1 unnamed protein product [Spirodela intermedia]